MQKVTYVWIVLFGAALLTRADDLTTRDGTVYKNYTVLSHDQGYLTILYADGGGKIPLCKLPDALQKKYDYDPVKAAAAVQAFVERDRAQALAVERAKAVAASTAPASPVFVPKQTAVQAVPSAPPVPSPARANEIQNKIAALQSQISQLEERASAADAKDDDRFNSDSNKYSQGNHVEHYYTKSHSQASVDSRAEIAALQDQIAALQSELLGGTTSPYAPLNPPNGNSADSLVGGSL